jgi:CheY-like chemotaxis protein
MRFFVWNDNPLKLKDWSDLIKSRSPGMTPEVHPTHELDIHKILAEFRAFDPDVVLLDIVASNLSRSHGVDIAREIRQFDSLIPILAITEDPSAVYEASGDLASLAFAGIHHASVMNKASFWSSALRPSLNNWHLIAPDYALIRQIVGQLQANTRDEGIRSSFQKLAALLVSLPLLGDTDVWHKAVSKEITWLMDPVFPNLAKKFSELSTLFQKADPFYMASTRSRKHLSHNVQVFLLGLRSLIVRGLMTIIFFFRLFSSGHVSD